MSASAVIPCLVTIKKGKSESWNLNRTLNTTKMAVYGQSDIWQMEPRKDTGSGFARTELDYARDIWKMDTKSVNGSLLTRLERHTK